MVADEETDRSTADQSPSVGEGARVPVCKTVKRRAGASAARGNFGNGLATFANHERMREMDRPGYSELH